ncbi:MAG: hypothetical protein JWN79_342, partial [Gemmatimonadetes bacterium]|nr:hypothetical protein [Gemmatimonadota bacterium]
MTPRARSAAATALVAALLLAPQGAGLAHAAIAPAAVVAPDVPKAAKKPVVKRRPVQQQRGKARTAATRRP